MERKVVKQSGYVYLIDESPILRMFFLQKNSLQHRGECVCSQQSFETTSSCRRIL